jgi:(p)ppGpp synthase/HD superfamily hydrolase
MPNCLIPVREILAAARFAAERHAAQRRKGNTAEPYVNHLLEVAELLARTADDLDTNLIVAALLHDTIEDVGVTREEIAERFGEDVASLVAEVTDDKSLPKETRKALQVERAPNKSPRAQALSAADKIANVRSIATSPPANWTSSAASNTCAGRGRWWGATASSTAAWPPNSASKLPSADLQEWEKSGGTNDFF